MNTEIWVGEEPNVTIENYKDIIAYKDKDNLVIETLDILSDSKIETIKSIFELESEINTIKNNLRSLRQRLKSINELSETIFNERTVK